MIAAAPYSKRGESVISPLGHLKVFVVVVVVHPCYRLDCCCELTML